MIERRMQDRRAEDRRKKEDEIDLYGLFLVLKGRYRLIAGIFAVAVVAAVVASLLLPPVYQSGFILRVSVISPLETGRLITGLNELLEEERFQELSGKLDIEEEAAERIVLLEADVPRKEEEKWYVGVNMEVRDPALINTLKDGILHYLNGNEYVRERVSLKRESLEHLRQEILAKIRKMEKLSNDVIGHIEQGRIKDIGFNPLELDKGIIGLRQEIKALDDQLQLIRGFEVAAEPVVPQRPVSPRKTLNVALAGVASLFFGVFLAFFMEWAGRARGGRA